MSWKEIMKEGPVNNAELRELIQHQEFIVKAIRGYMENFHDGTPHPIPQRHIEVQTNRAVAVLEYLKKLDLAQQSIDGELPRGKLRDTRVRQELNDKYPLPDEEDLQ